MVREQRRATRTVRGWPTRSRRTLVRLVCAPKVPGPRSQLELDVLCRDLPVGFGQNTGGRLTLVMTKQIVAAL